MKILSQLDDIDLQIISILSLEGKTPYAEIGKKLFVSGGTVHVRIKKLMELGVITGSQITVDYSKLGFDIIAFIGVYLEKSQYYDSVSASLADISEIVETHYTTGVYSIFAKIICKDTDNLREILSKQIQNIDGVARTETFISLEEPIHRPPTVFHKG